MKLSRIVFILFLSMHAYSLEISKKENKKSSEKINLQEVIEENEDDLGFLVRSYLRHHDIESEKIALCKDMPWYHEDKSGSDHPDKEFCIIS